MICNLGFELNNQEEAVWENKEKHHWPYMNNYASGMIDIQELTVTPFLILCMFVNIHNKKMFKIPSYEKVKELKKMKADMVKC